MHSKFRGLINESVDYQSYAEKEHLNINSNTLQNIWLKNIVEMISYKYTGN